jgi:PEP-CTERM motif
VQPNTFYKIKIAVLVLAANILFSAPAQAILQLSLSDGVTTVLISDSGGSGNVGYSGTLGNFNILYAAGASTPMLGSAGEPQLDLGSFSVTSTNGGGTLTILLTDTDFTAAGSNLFSVSIGGTLTYGGTLEYSAYQDNSNLAFGTTNALCSLNFNTTAYSGQCSNDIIADDLYSLTLKTVVTLLGPKQNVSYNAEVQIPEPSAMVLTGAGLVIVAVWRRRRLRRRSN